MRVLENTKQRILDAGFSHIKLELEAQLGRDASDDEERECYDCDGEGRVDCNYCYGTSVLESEDESGNIIEMECDECEGWGRQDCDNCEGSGRTGESGYHSDSWCQDVILRNVSAEAREALTYGNFYYDGSVDSEYTFTLPVAKAEYLVEYIEAFKLLGAEVGNGLDVSGAGMHITVIPTESNGYYPSDYRIDSDKLENFTTQVTKLLPALFFAASSDAQSRSLGYRIPQISNSEKYSAIYTHRGTCLEYRLFETCYDNPEAIFEYMEVIANTLEYMDVEKKVEVKYKNFNFEFEGYRVDRFYKTPEQLRALNETIKHIKPSQKSFRKMKQERQLMHTIKSLSVSTKRKVAQLREEWREIERRNQERREAALTIEQQERIRREMQWNDLTREQAENSVRGISHLNFESFLAQNLYRRAFTLSVN